MIYIPFFLHHTFLFLLFSFTRAVRVQRYLPNYIITMIGIQDTGASFILMKKIEGLAQADSLNLIGWLTFMDCFYYALFIDVLFFFQGHENIYFSFCCIDNNNPGCIIHSSGN